MEVSQEQSEMLTQYLINVRAMVVTAHEKGWKHRNCGFTLEESKRFFFAEINPGLNEMREFILEGLRKI